MVMINGEAREIAGKNLLEYLKENGFNPEQLVVERNFEIISKEQFGSVTIQDEDVIEVLRFVGGAEKDDRNTEKNAGNHFERRPGSCI